MTNERLAEILKNGESSTIEFKRCGAGIEEDTYQTVCSFSNKFGGDIFCGVLDDGTACGVPQAAAREMIRNFISVTNNQNMFSPTLSVEPELLEYAGKTIIHIHVPVSPEVHSFKKIIYDRVGDADVKTISTTNIAEMYIRKADIFTEQKIYEYVELQDLRLDLIALCRQRAVNKRSDHPWKNLSDMELLKSARLYGKDYETGKIGFNLAAVLLLGKDDVIGSVCPVYKTDALLRKVNIDRYDDREIIQTNLIEGYDQLIAFSRKHLWDKFYMEGNQTVSLRDKIVREMVSNVLIHREFTSAFVAKLVIEADRMYTENACRAAKQEEITPENFVPVSKNPIIATFFTTIGNADELGSGTRNLFKYTKLYSGKNPLMREDVIFTLSIPLDEAYSFDANIGKAVAKPAPAGDAVILSANQKKILEAIRGDATVTAVRLSEMIGISSRKVEDNLKFLREKKIIGRIGSHKRGKWVIL